MRHFISLQSLADLVSILRDIVKEPVSIDVHLVHQQVHALGLSSVDLLMPLNDCCLDCVLRVEGVKVNIHHVYLKGVIVKETLNELRCLTLLSVGLDAGSHHKLHILKDTGVLVAQK